MANSSSLPEAGGELADYFDVRSERDFQEKLERLIDDVPYREGRERRIRGEFVPRSWRQIAEQMVNHCSRATTPGRSHPTIARPVFRSSWRVTIRSPAIARR